MIAQPQPQPESTWKRIVRLLRWDKPEGRLILMIPALWAVVLATQGSPPWPLVGAIVLGSLATSAAGCVVNDLWDRNIDPQVERTRNRPLAARALSVQTAVVVAAIAFLVALACAVAIAWLYLNPLTLWLAVAAVPVIVLYPSAKRIFPVPQLVLSIAWGFAVLISWSAATASLEPATWLLWGATVLWTLGFDTIYAMADRDDDRRIGVHSSALFFGDLAAIAIGLFFAGTVALLIVLGIVLSLHFSFWICLAIAALGWINQVLRLRQSPLPRKVYGQMFRQNVWQGLLILLGTVAGSLL